MAVKEKKLLKDESGQNGGRSYQVIGTRPIRHDGMDKVTGRAQYGIDVRLPGMLYGAVLRSPHAHAWIRSIDTEKAAKYPGVHAVITAGDMPELESIIKTLGEGSINIRFQSNNVLAREKVLYFGHAVAAVAAVNPYVAEEALKLIYVEYEVLPPVMNVRDAMKPDAIILHNDLRTDEMGAKSDKPSNIASHHRIQRGDLEKGFNEAAVTIEREYFTSTVHQGYIEPLNATALWSLDNQLTIWSSTQGAFGARDQVADILKLPVSKIKVIPMEIGGGFGGRIGVGLEPIAALLARKCSGRPVKMTMSRAEVLAASGPASGTHIRVKLGADKAGKLTAAQITLAYEAGAYPGSSVGMGANIILGPYLLENVQIDGYDVVVNKPRSAAYRAPGGTMAGFAAESAIDELAEKIGIDPFEFRQMNAVKEGDRRADGLKFGRIGLLEVLEAAQTHPHYTAPLTGPNQGRGVACAYWANYGGKSSASASLNPDGTISLSEGSVDIGGSRTSLAMQMAETLSVPVENIRPQVVDTDSVGYTETTYGSRTTFTTGIAVYNLGKNLISEMVHRVADDWGINPDEIRYERGSFYTSDKVMTIPELAGKWDTIPVSASASVQVDKFGPAFAAHIVDVEVDPETGKVQILRYTAVQDVGTAIHPSYVEGQMQGAVVQGIGWGLNEEYVYDESGRLLNSSFLDYRIPTALDAPMIDTLLVEVPEPNHPYGVRGVGEVPIIPPPAAIANAIYRAVGKRMNTLPMSPTRIMEAMVKKDV